MSKFQLNDSIKEILNSKNFNIPHSKIIIERNWITFNDLIYIHQNYLISNFDNNKNIQLKDFIKGLKFYSSPKFKPSYSKEFQQSLDLIKLKLEEESYQKLINNYKSSTSKKFNDWNNNDEILTPHQINKQINEQLTTILNIFISVGSVVYAIWYWTKNYNNLPFRILLCLFFGILILIAEVVVYNSYLNKISKARKLERNKKEIKKVVDTIVFNNSTNELINVDKISNKKEK
ncbi:hypothetical protein WICMUC_000246 [Wickerhamomyces mucosus]|uniref:Vacuolar ATPase assembly integral membrane protein VPH2 n=1 Tax=Wickerhamomyces mucosus TaxID=1378264 RepID=A0A9P8PYM4_9ASCO|nr:hypothetical protein WICMUC_000246 [Wickerhamomyces mucosus]